MGFLEYQPQFETDIGKTKNNIFKRWINGVKTQGFNRIQTEDLCQTDNCWICDGWQEFRFEYVIDENSILKQGPIYLHLKFENFMPFKMDQSDQNDQLYICYRMIPPGMNPEYCFSNVQTLQLIHSHDQDTCENEHFQEKQLQLNYILGIQREKIFSVDTPHQLNFQLYFIPKKVISESTYSPLVECIPRDSQGFHKREKKVGKYEQDEDFKNDIDLQILMPQKRAKKEVLTHMDKMFFKDWNDSKIPTKIIKDEEDQAQLKKFIRMHYDKIVNQYKLLSSQYMINDAYAINLNIFTEFALTSEIIDQKNLLRRDSDFQFLSTTVKNQKSSQDDNYRRPERALIRFQFLEMLVRLAGEKYIKNGKCKTFTQAFQKMFNETLDPYFQQQEQIGMWRTERFLIKQTKMQVSQSKEFLKEIYAFFQGKDQHKIFRYVEGKLMNFYEFKSIFIHYDLIDDFLTDKDIQIIFNLSIEYQIDETLSDKFVNMNYNEFVEGLTRVAEQISLIPYGQSYDDWTDDQRSVQPTFQKLKNLLNYMYNYDKDLRAKELNGGQRDKLLVLPLNKANKYIIDNLFYRFGQNLSKSVQKLIRNIRRIKYEQYTETESDGENQENN